VNKNVGVKAIESNIPLIGKIGVVPNVLPMRMTGSEAIVGVDYRSFTMRLEQFLQYRGVLFFPWPIKNKPLHPHDSPSGIAV
jgi:hypothetical protein